MKISDFNLIRTSRKTVALEVTERGSLIIRAPKYLGKKYIQQIVEKNNEWIMEKLEKIKEEEKKYPPKKFVDGEVFWYLGKPYKLTVTSDNIFPLVFNDGFFISESTGPDRRQLFIDWYRERAFEKIKERVEYYTELTGFNYEKINITAAMKRWGSCSGRGNLNFPWRLIMAPPLIIDYVVIHEVVHLKYRNHSKRFWSQVRKFFPDYKDCRKWLRENRKLFVL